MRLLLLVVVCALSAQCSAQESRRVGRLQEVFAWKQVTYNINGNHVVEDRFADLEEGDGARRRRQAGGLVFEDQNEQDRNWNQNSQHRPSSQPSWQQQQSWTSRPTSSSTTTTRRPSGPTSSSTTTTRRPSDESPQFFTQYNNLPMGMERVGNRLFVTVPRRRYGIPSTLNYLDLTEDSHTRSPGLRPYPDMRRSRSITSVYRTRADHCNRLWMVDTGLLEIPDNRQQVQQPAIVVFDLKRDTQVLRYALKSTDIVSSTTPTGLASITLDFPGNDCSNVYAYIPDLATYGLIVYSLRDNDSWRLTHNYFSFNPLAGNLRIAGQSFQWSDGIFSITLTEPGRDSCRTAYFHAMVGTTEFSVSTCVLRNSTASQSSDFWQQFSVVGDRGSSSQSTMHGYHAPTNVVFFADIGRDAISCWQAGTRLAPTNVAILAQDSTRLSYPSDLHVTGDEVWVMANSLPTWAYSRLDTSQHNFFIYKANVQDLIANTVCTGRPQSTRPGFQTRMGEDGAAEQTENTNVDGATESKEESH